MTPAHPETEETAHTLAAMQIARSAPPVRVLSLAEVWEAIELWWLAFLARLIARGEDVPLCACCEAKMCGLAEGSQGTRSPMGVYLAAAPQLSTRARRHLARGMAERLRAMRACGERWRAWVWGLMCNWVSRERAFATVRAALICVPDVSVCPLRVSVGRGPPGRFHIHGTEPFGSPSAPRRGVFWAAWESGNASKLCKPLHLPLIPAQAGIQFLRIAACSRAGHPAASLGPRLRGGERNEGGEEGER